jgi:hypothetical protein
MPKGVFRRKIKSGPRKGKFMYMRGMADGKTKIISKSAYDSAKKRGMGSRSPMVRKSKPKSSRKTPLAKFKQRGNRSMKKSIPHPSVTGMASGLAIASYLNAGGTTSFGGKSVQLDGVIKDVTDGELGKAFSTLSGNAIDMIGTEEGRKTLVGASLVAVAGAFARSRFPNLKLGGSKLYFRI